MARWPFPFSFWLPAFAASNFFSSAAVLSFLSFFFHKKYFGVVVHRRFHGALGSALPFARQADTPHFL
jgi:hypothetical protein